jgi:hypothetical protein
MRELLAKFKKETFIEYLCQHHFYRRSEIEKDLLFIEWEHETKAAGGMMDNAIASIKKAKTIKARLAAEIEFEKAQNAYKRADRTWNKLEALQREKA